MTKVPTAMNIGVLAGVGFFVHAMVPNSHAWPMLWPAAGGLLAVLLTARDGAVTGFWNSIGLGLKTGAIAGAVFFGATAAALWLLSSSQLTRLARQLGAEGPINAGAASVGLAMAAIIGLVLATVSAGAAHPLARSRA
ncbi:MAG TPA: hypothetical protein VIA98_13545 [Allosphingosinicella sp.]|jgi:hypothetical protein